MTTEGRALRSAGLDLGAEAPAAFRGGGPTRFDQPALELIMAAMLDRFPEAELMALGSTGLIVPMPAVVPIGGHRVIDGYATVLDLVAANDLSIVIDTWREAQHLGTAGAEVHIRSTPDETARLTFIDVTPRYGVVVAVLVGSELHLPPPTEPTTQKPRRCQCRKNQQALMIGVDAAFTRLLGWSEAELFGCRSLDLVHPDDQHRAVAAWMDMIAHPETELQVRLRHRHKDGSWVWLEVTNHNRLMDPAHGDVLAEIVNIAEEMAAQEALQASESLLRALTEALPLGILHFDLERKIRYKNERVGRILGKSKSETLAGQLLEVLPADRTAVEEAVEAALGGQDGDVEVRLRRARRCRLRLRGLTDTGGTITGAVLSVADITEDARLRDELQQRATYDALTQCLNRAAILDALEATLSGGANAGTAVVFFDVDHFKQVNDQYGHGPGDQLLVAVARRLRLAARSADLVGRIGGDEFIVVCRDIASPEAAVQVAERLAENLGEPLSIGAIELTPKASIGVAWTDQEMEADALVDRADAAMYESKRQRLGQPVMLTT